MHIKIWTLWTELEVEVDMGDWIYLDVSNIEENSRVGHNAKLKLNKT